MMERYLGEIHRERTFRKEIYLLILSDDGHILKSEWNDGIVENM